MSQAGLLNLEANNPQIPTEFITDDGTAIPIANSIEILGTDGVTTSGSGNTITISLEGGSIAIDTINTISPDGSGNFTVAAGSGITVTPGANQITVGLAGGSAAIDSIAVQATSGSGVSPVVPTVAGLVTINGTAVNAQTVPIQSRSIAPNSLQIEVQRASSSASTNTTQQGLASFDSADFNVDGSGWVTLAGSGSSLIGITDTISPFRTALGSGALTSSSGENNTAVGFNALTANTTGINNQAIGVSALGSNVGGQQNIAIGNSALGAASLVDNCVAIGHNSLTSYAVQNATVAIGVNSLRLCSTGINNLAIGHDCLREVTVGTNNTAVGYTAGDSITTGINNTLFGSGAANGLDTGSANICIGANAGNALSTSESNNIDIGHAGIVGDSGVIRIGTSGTQTASHISGVLTLINQPAFLATHTVAQTSVTGAGTNATVNFTNEVYDQASNYDGTNTFTADTDGIYFFSCSVAFSQLDALATEGVIRFITTAGNFQSQAMNYGAIRQGGASADSIVLSHTCMVRLVATNTVSVQVNVNGMLGDTVDIPAEGSLTYFSGVKIA